MNSELIPVMIGFTVVYAWTLIVAGGDLIRLHKENAKLRREVAEASRVIAIKRAAEEKDYETARLLAAVHSNMVKTKPSLSAGAKPEEKSQTGLRITQSG